MLLFLMQTHKNAHKPMYVCNVTREFVKDQT
jgi:hypothetical protein